MIKEKVAQNCVNRWNPLKFCCFKLPVWISSTQRPRRDAKMKWSCRKRKTQKKKCINWDELSRVVWVELSWVISESFIERKVKFRILKSLYKWMSELKIYCSLNYQVWKMMPSEKWFIKLSKLKMIPLEKWFHEFWIWISVEYLNSC